MPKADITIEIMFNVKHPDNTVIRTNTKKRAIEEILDIWLHNQMGRGADGAKPNKRSNYTIKIRLDLSDDTFYTTSNTGNKSLTCGIVLKVLLSFKNGRTKLRVQSLGDAF